jgi:hypothetical protein
LLHESPLPANLGVLSHGFVIELPVDNIASYVHNRISWLRLKSDDDLANHLHKVLLDSKSTSVDNIAGREIDIFNTPYFMNLSSHE